MLNIDGYIRRRVRFAENVSLAHEDMAKIDDIITPYGAGVDTYKTGLRFMRYEVIAQNDADLRKLDKIAPRIEVALNCSGVQVRREGGRYIIERPIAGNNYECLVDDVYRKLSGDLPIMVGLDVSRNPICIDLAKQPHILVAGTTGSGKSVFLNSVVASLLINDPHSEIYIIDAKGTEFTTYTQHPTVYGITDTSMAVNLLNRLTRDMDYRYEELKKRGYRDIYEARKHGMNMKPVVCIIDEFADLMLNKTYSKDIETSVVRLAQKARAAGIHLVIATQRPTANVITGLIKANIPCRVCFKVTSSMESRIILDRNGGEKLLGHGDMLMLENGAFEPIHAQGVYILPKEAQNIAKLAMMESVISVEPTRQDKPKRKRIFSFDHFAHTYG